MRILYTMHGWKPAYRLGGPIVSVAAAAERLVQKGHEVIAAVTNSNLDQDLDVPIARPIDVNGVQVWYFKREEPLQKYLPFLPYVAQSMGFLYAPTMKAALDRLVPGVDCVNTHIPFVYPTYAGSRAALRHGKPLFYHQRGNFLESHLARRRAKKELYIAMFEKSVVRRATTLIALTDAEKQAFARLAPGVPCRVVPNGVDVPASDAFAGAAERVAQRYGVPPGVPLILFLSRIHTWKGVDQLVEAFVRIQVRHPDAVLVVAGPDECDAERRWSRVAAEKGFADRLLFPGVVTGQDKHDLLGRADLFCLPSQGEWFSMAVLEAMAHSTPVLLTPECNFNQAIEAGGGRTSSSDPEALAGAIEEMLGDQDALRRMGEAGRRLVIDCYSWDSITDRLLEVYVEGIARARKNAA